MTPGLLRDFFAHGEFEADAAFRSVIERLMRRALRIIAAVEIGMTGLTLTIRTLTVAMDRVPGWIPISFVLMGLCSYLAARYAPRGSLRVVTYALGLLTIAALSWLSVEAAPSPSGEHSMVNLLLVLMVTVVAVPGTFWQTLIFGFAVIVVNIAILAVHGAPLWARDAAFVGSLFTILVLCAFLSGSNYGRLVSEHRANETALQAEVRQMQTEMASSMSRIAAALSHELNNPLGALKSSVSSLVSASEKMASQPSPKILEAQRELARVATDSAARLESIIGRMQRFANLDRADVQNVDVGRVIEDVAGLCLHKNQLHVDASDLPPVVARPQVLSGAFASLLQRATDAGGEVFVVARPEASAVTVRIQAPGAFALEPSFGERDGRISALNWDLFHVRQLIRSEGGELTKDESGLVITFPLGNTLT